MTRPGSLPYAEFMALADAVAAPHPSWRELFETAAACDLLVTCLLDGDQAMATDVLADDDTRDTTVALLRWAITGDSRSVQQRRAHAMRSAETGLPAACWATSSGRCCGSERRRWPGRARRTRGLARRSSPSSAVTGDGRRRCRVLDRLRLRPGERQRRRQPVRRLRPPVEHVRRRAGTAPGMTRRSGRRDSPRQPGRRPPRPSCPRASSADTRG